MRGGDDAMFLWCHLCHIFFNLLKNIYNMLISIDEGLLAALKQIARRTVLTAKLSDLTMPQIVSCVGSTYTKENGNVVGKVTLTDVHGEERNLYNAVAAQAATAFNAFLVSNPTATTCFIVNGVFSANAPNDTSQNLPMFKVPLIAADKGAYAASGLSELDYRISQGLSVELV